MQQPCLPTAQRRVRSPAGHHAQSGHRRGHPGGRAGCDGELGPAGRRDEAPLAPEWRFCSCSWALGPPRGRAQNWARNRPRRAVKGARGHPRDPLGRLDPWRAFIQRSTLAPKTGPKPPTSDYRQRCCYVDVAFSVGLGARGQFGHAGSISGLRTGQFRGSEGPMLTSMRLGESIRHPVRHAVPVQFYGNSA